MSPLVIIFLTIFVNLVGFGIIIPLLPFYAQTFGASPLTIGLLFASFSISQLVASPVLGHWSDRYGRRPVLIFSLLGTAASFALLAVATHLAVVFVARIIDGLSGGNISTARAYIADVTDEEHRARAYGFLGAAFGLGFIFGPGLAGALAPMGYQAPIWAAVGLTLVAALVAWVYLPETVHRTHASTPAGWSALQHVPGQASLRRLLGVDFLYWLTFAAFQTTFALFGARRFGFGPVHIGYILSAFGGLSVLVQAVLVAPLVRRFGERIMLLAGLTLASLGLAGAAASYSMGAFFAALAPVAVGMGLSVPALITLLSRSAPRGEQGRVQGVASALESLGRTVGPVWGNGSLQRFGEGAAYGSAAIVLAATVVIAAVSGVGASRGDIRGAAD